MLLNVIIVFGERLIICAEMVKSDDFLLLYTQHCLTYKLNHIIMLNHLEPLWLLVIERLPFSALLYFILGATKLKPL